MDTPAQETGLAQDRLWTPDRQTVERANLTDYMTWLRERRGLDFDDYHALWRWSVQDIEAFWASIWDYYGLDQDSAYDAVLPTAQMPGARWFPGARVNFARECLRRASDDQPALVTVHEGGSPVETSWADLQAQVAAMAAWLREIGVQPGDRVAAYLPNIPEAVVALLATASVGAVWTASSPDFGTSSVLTRLQQVEPSVLIAADGYYYGGKEFDRRPVVEEIVEALPSVRHVVTVDYVYDGGPWLSSSAAQQTPWRQALDRQAELDFADVAFDHPLWVLWSSGTTGTPKGIVQGHGGIVLELLKAVGLGSDVRADDRFFFMTSTSWMVWNYLVAGLMHGATIVLYDGSATYQDVNAVWRVAQDTGATMVGVGAGYLIAGEKAQARPGEELDLSRMRSILQTGSTLPPTAWRWTYEHVKSDVWMQSISGGTDVCSVLAGGCPLLARLSYQGLPDIRVICADDEPRLAMLRLPTGRSGGRANLHQGAIGAAVDIDSGRVVAARMGRKDLQEHPDTGERLLGAHIPFWDDVLYAAARCGPATGLRYVGADVVIEAQGPLILEVNARPGLQIQNVTASGMRALLEAGV